MAYLSVCYDMSIDRMAIMLWAGEERGECDWLIMTTQCYAIRAEKLSYNLH